MAKLLTMNLNKAWQEASTRIHELALSLEVFVMSLALIIDPLERKARKLQEQLDVTRCANLEQCRLGRVPTCNNVSLADANLKGANLKGANLKGVNLEGANS